MSQRIKIPQYDNGIKLIFTIKKDTMVESLQGATILFKLKHTTEGLTIVRECKITDATAGECEYVLTTQDLSVVGAYISEIETRFANGTILSVDNPIILTVTPEQIDGNRRRRV